MGLEKEDQFEKGGEDGRSGDGDGGGEDGPDGGKCGLGVKK